MAEKRRKKSFFKTIFRVLYTLVILLAAGFLLGIGLSLFRTLPDIKDIGEYKPNETSKVYASDGRLLAKLCIENRELIPITDIPVSLQEAIVAIEDSRFYSHHGVDLRGIGRALMENFRAGGISQGGSTITQQLARNIYLSQRRTITRKLKEVVLALQIERKYSKEEILEMYLNQVYFGSGAYGVQTAAHVYFGKKAADLNLAEASLLAGLPKAPSNYSPYINMDLAKSRQALVLERMAELGYITSEESEEAKETQIRLSGFKAAGLIDNKAPYFVSYLLFPLIDKYGADIVYKGGLNIETTLDLDMQEAAEKAVQEGLAASRGLRISQGALIALDVKTGQIKAMVGGKSFKESQFNRATQARRQPGSAFKPFVYTTAIDGGMKPEDSISDSPVSYGTGAGIYRPRNYDGRFRGRMTLRSALERSINVPAVKLMEKMGVLNVLDYVKRMGITTVSPAYDSNLACALGGLTYGVIPIEMATAYGVLANDGVKCQPTAILRVTDHWGNVLEDFKPRTERVLRSETAVTMTDMMRGVITRGTGRSASIGYRAAGKTGTTSDYKDAWFVGFTDKLVAAAWVGNDNNRPMAHGVVGGTVPARIWAGFMRKAMRKAIEDEKKHKAKELTHLLPEAIPADDGEEIKGKDGKEETDRKAQDKERNEETGSDVILVCAESGLLPTPECPEVISRTVAGGKGPSRHCNIHGGHIEPATRTEKPEASTTRKETAQPQPRTAGSITWQEVRFCRLSGDVAGSQCPETYTRRLRKERIPQTRCAVHN